MKKYGYILMVAALSFMMVALVGCSSDDKATTTQTAKVTTTTAATTEEKPKNSRTKKVIKKALEIYKENPKYSLAKRMEEGYIDCSTYVWKCYRPIGMYFGDSGYAPTAADIAHWCNGTGRLLDLKKVNKDTSKLEPGDLLFYPKPSGDNGRYKNISHVSIYVGNGRIIHCDGTPPKYGDPWYREVVAVARPVK